MDTAELARRLDASWMVGDEASTSELVAELERARRLVVVCQANVARLAGLLTKRSACPETGASDARRASELEPLPEIRTAWEAGAVPTPNVETVLSLGRRLRGRHRSGLSRRQSELAAKAAELDPKAFRAHCAEVEADLLGLTPEDLTARRRRRRRGQRFTHPDGMGELRLLFDPITRAKVWSVLDERCAQLAAQRRDLGDPDTTEELLLVDAAEDLLCGRAGGASAPVVIIRGPHALSDPTTVPAGTCTTTDGTPLPAVDVAVECCDTDLDIVRCDIDWQPLNVGRLHRAATPAQRTALKTLYTTCAFPDCTRPIERCHIHHYDPWAHGHPTNLDNLAPYCPRHHHLLHNGWTTTTNPNGTRTLTTPHGQPHATLPPPRPG